MMTIYSIIVFIAGFLLQIIAVFNTKIKLFVNGRKTVFADLKSKINSNDKTIWFHAASLGEFEQGRPVIEKIKEKYPSHKIVLSFFSPSGFEVRKNNTIADVTVYLPLDTPKNARTFIELVHPEMVFFIKYEFWPNYLDVLKKQQIKTYLVSGIFRKSQVFFKWYGGFYKKALEAFTFFFVQNNHSFELLSLLGKKNVIVTGDTRFDRVSTILEQDNRLDFIDDFKNNTLTFVAGSTWPKDEEILLDFINSTSEKIKFIIAPHNIKPEQIAKFQSQCNKKVVLFSEKENKKLADFEVFVIDTIGILTKIYAYADIAYVGGGFGKPGIHNILEPATFGVPIIIGPNYSHFDEAKKLVQLRGCFAIFNNEEFQIILNDLIEEEELRAEKGNICAQFVQENKGAVNRILENVLLS